jgi:hypothetical protein
MTAIQLANLCLCIGAAVGIVGLGALWWDIKGRKDE